MDNMRILVTGGCGFIGSNFVRYIGTIAPGVVIVNQESVLYKRKQIAI